MNVPDVTVDAGWQLAFSCMTGWGGNVGNEIFMIISGYFMINSRIHWKRIILLVAAMFFYSWLIALIFYGIAGAPFHIKDVVKALIPLWGNLNWFVCCYLMFICFVPFINPLLNGLTRTRYQWLLLLNYLMIIFLPALSLGGPMYMKGAFFQFFMMYILGGYIRLYGFHSDRFRNAAFWWKLMGVLFLVVALGSVFPLIAEKFWGSYWRIVHLVEMPMALGCFMAALCHRPFFSPTVNKMAASVLGIYLIHDNPVVRQFLWQDWYPNIDFLNSVYFPAFMIGKVMLVFLVCLGIDQFRLHFIEPHVQRYMDEHWDSWEKKLVLWQRNLQMKFWQKL